MNAAGKKHRKPKLRVLLDALIVLAFIVICLVLAKTLLDQLHLKNQVKSATVVTNQVIEDIRKKDGKAVLAKSYGSFKSDNSPEFLSSRFLEIEKQTRAKSSIRHQIVTNDKAGEAVTIIYKFESSPAIFVSVLVQKPNGTEDFKVAKLGVNTNEQKLLGTSK